MLQLFVFMQNKISAALAMDDRGATAVEYGLIVALIAVIIAVAVAAVGTGLRTTFQNVVGSL
jgi:pilus assembly protein Flp/PilA